MAFVHEVTDEYGTYTEIVEDRALAARLEAGDPVAFRALVDQWDATFTTRTIHRAELLDTE